MKHENYIYAGTFDEFRNFIIDKIYEDCKNEKETSFKGYDFAFCTSNPSLDSDIKELYDDAEGWYGIKVLESPFNDSSNRQFISNYYGGGDFGICNIFLDDLNRDYIAREVEKMITLTFGYGYSKESCVWMIAPF